MLREARTEQELLALVSAALESNPDTCGWSPTGIQEQEEDTEGCNWDIHYLRGNTDAAEVKDVVMPVAAGIINTLRNRYSLL
ncbi:hypothetical protein [Paraburkholderia saeva]|uniref:Uncharacterized protein n=1 Tax=Paraburkholderia saeva TaxID=2777537 RepID=A0A9N8RWA0_9BURK|nr:hypothetical protein [Paraburkholderia saeva]CAG4897379.1 hypothetical protein LMG31841_02460 [Paraburkholderia saeva]CAG4913774.1 hypothetical protein R52603_04165 [Paraburkholderia saeva]CAG4919826.1 hypothetical protein R70241_04786 [Paraburkholderia saeva]